MKKTILLLSVILTLALLFSSCDYTKKVIGIWDSESTLSVQGIEANRLVFAEDGTGYAEGNGGRVEFKFLLTDDTMTFQFPEVGWGVLYSVKGDTLTVRDCVFTRTDSVSGIR